MQFCKADFKIKIDISKKIQIQVSDDAKYLILNLDVFVQDFGKTTS